MSEKLDLDALEHVATFAKDAAHHHREAADEEFFEHFHAQTALALIARIRAFESASQPGSGEAWQPIETAPKDGTEIALLFAEEVDIVGRHRPRVRAALWCGDRSIPYYRNCPPTHWRPLPAAPSSENGEAKGGREVQS